MPAIQVAGHAQGKFYTNPLAVVLMIEEIIGNLARIGQSDIKYMEQIRVGGHRFADSRQT